MEIFNNTTKVVKDDLQKTIASGSHLSIAAACFSIYAYQELKSQLEACEELRFIFTSPTFVAEKTPKERREFYIPRLKREKSLYGTEFEVRLRNELKQKAVARECAAWIRKKAKFRTNTTRESMNNFLVVESSNDMSKQQIFRQIKIMATVQPQSSVDNKSEIVAAVRQQSSVVTVFRDVGIASDSVMTNFEQILETYSPQTQRKVL